MENKRFQYQRCNGFIKCSFYRLNVIILESIGHVLDSFRNTRIAAGDTDIPIMPAVVPTAKNFVAPRKGPRHTNGRRTNIGPCFGDLYRLSVWYNLLDKFTKLNLQRMH